MSAIHEAGKIAMNKVQAPSRMRAFIPDGSLSSCNDTIEAMTNIVSNNAVPMSLIAPGDSRQPEPAVGTFISIRPTII